MAGIARRGMVLKLLTGLKQICNHPAQYLKQPGPLAGRSGKLAALDEHCANLGRDRSQITVSYQTSACIAPTHEQAVAEFEAYLARQPEAEARRTRRARRGRGFPRSPAGGADTIRPAEGCPR